MCIMNFWFVSTLPEITGEKVERKMKKYQVGGGGGGVVGGEAGVVNRKTYLSFVTSLQKLNRNSQ